MKFLKRFLLRIFKRGYDSYWRAMYNGYRESYDIDPTFRFNGTNIYFYGNGRIICGSNSYIGNYSTIQTAKNCIVKIGNFCSVSHNVRIYTRTAITDQDFTQRPLKTKEGCVQIEDGVWIGANVFINPGIRIGRNSVVGANSVVTKDIPENAIYAGAPAKLIRFKKIQD